MFVFEYSMVLIRTVFIHVFIMSPLHVLYFPVSSFEPSLSLCDTNAYFFGVINFHRLDGSNQIFESHEKVNIVKFFTITM